MSIFPRQLVSRIEILRMSAATLILIAAMMMAVHSSLKGQETPANGENTKGVQIVHKYVHWHETIIDNSQKDKKFEFHAEGWGAYPDRGRIEISQCIEVRNGHKSWSYQKDRNVYSYSQTKTAYQLVNPTIEFWEGKYKHESAQTHIEHGNKQYHNHIYKTEEIDRPAYERSNKSIVDRVHVLIYIEDGNSHYTKARETDTYDAAGKVYRTQVVEYDYPDSIDDSVFTFVPPAGATLTQ